MAEYRHFTAARTTEPDADSLLDQLHAAVDPTMGVQHFPGTADYVLKKTDPWTPDNISAAQVVLDTAPEPSARLAAQAFIDNLPPQWRAFLPLFLKQVNVLRTSLATPLPQLTAAQLLNAFRNEAGNL